MKKKKEIKEDKLKEYNVLIGSYSDTYNSYGIALGKNACANEKYMFAFTADLEDLGMLTQFSTIMTPKEWEVVYAVVIRAVNNGKRLK